MATLVKENTTELEALDERLTALIDERKLNIRMSKRLRGTIEETSDLRKELKTIIRGLRPRSKQMDELQKQRNEIDQRIGIPLYRIKKLMTDVYEQLTGEIDIFQVPSLQREEDQFAWFFELQAMHEQATLAQESHQAFIALLKEQKEAVRALKENEKEQLKHKTELIESEPMLKDLDLNFSDAMQFDKKAHKLMKVIDQRRTEVRRLRREKGRLEAWVRISSNPNPTRSCPKRQQEVAARSEPSQVLQTGSLATMARDLKTCKKEQLKVEHFRFPTSMCCSTVAGSKPLQKATNCEIQSSPRAKEKGQCQKSYATSRDPFPIQERSKGLSING